MAKLWAGRTSGETDRLADDFTDTANNTAGYEIQRTILQKARSHEDYSAEAEEIERLSLGEKDERTRGYTRLFKDLTRRMLEPGIFLDNTRDTEEDLINAEKIAVGA